MVFLLPAASPCDGCPTHICPETGHEAAQVVWRAVKLRLEGSSWAEVCAAADQHARQIA